MKLNGAYPRTPDAFGNMVERTLASLPDECARPTTARCVPPRRVLLIAALAAITLIGGMALAAAHMGLIDMLFYGRSPSPAAAESVENIGASDAQDGYSLSAEQYLIDGDKLHLSLDMGAPDGAYTLAFTNISASVDGCITASAPDEYALAALGGDFGAQRQFYGQLVFDTLPDAPFDVTVDAYFLKPALPVRAYSPAAEDSFLLSDGSMPAYMNDSIYVSDSSGTFFPTMRADMRGRGGDYYGDPASMLSRMGIADEVMHLRVKFTVDPNASAGTLRALAVPMSADFPEYTFTIRRADFSAASAILLFEVHPRRDIAEITMSNDDPLYRWYEPRLPDGTPIDCSMGGGYSTERDPYGNVYLDYEMRLGGISELPDEITLVPYRIDGGGTRVYFEDEAVKVPLADTSR